VLDEFLPDHRFSEVHSTVVSATPAEALAAAKAARLGEMPLVSTLFALRSLPALIRRGRGLPSDRSRSLYEQMLGFGFVLLVEDDRGLVLGYVGQPWRPAGGTRPRVRTPEEWRAFSEPGYVKAAMSFTASAEGTGARLATETRVQATDPATERKFGRYWRLIRGGSGLIRRSWLRAARRRAES
jgi:hypothetical protein